MMRAYFDLWLVVLVFGLIVGCGLRRVYLSGVAAGIERGAAIASSFGSCQ